MVAMAGKTLASILVNLQNSSGSNKAIVRPNGQFVSWKEHLARVSILSSAIANFGLSAGDRFAIICGNSETFIELLHAGYWSGAIPVPINPHLSRNEINKILDATRIDLIFTDSKNSRMFRDTPALRRDRKVIVDDPENIADLPSLTTFEEFSAGGIAAPPAERNEDDVALILFSGGTTGPEKGVLLTHKNLISNATQIAKSLRTNSSDIWLHAAPMYHSADLLANSVTLFGGAHMFLGVFTPRAFVQVLEAHSISRVMLPPSAVFALLQNQCFLERDLNSLVSFIVGGASVPLDLRKELQTTLPDVSVIVGYGLTETSPIVSFLDFRKELQTNPSDSDKLGSVGLPLEGTDARIVDGELQVRGPGVSVGYLGVQKIVRASRGNWFRTGDLAKISQDGYICILDRSKDVIISSGINVYSPDVEAVLYSNPKVREVAVIGTPHPKYGEAVTAVVVTHNDVFVTASELKQYSRKYLGVVSVPRSYFFVSRLPRNAAGKVLKRELRNKFGNLDG
jgi:long-chain acyl-CoA synthetase